MLKVLQVRIQEQGSYRFRNSKYAKLDWSRRWFDRSRCNFTEF